MTTATAQESRRAAVPEHGVTFGEAFRVWARVALLSFGGPAAQIAVMHRILVDEKHWVSESRFLYALRLRRHCKRTEVFKSDGGHAAKKKMPTNAAAASRSKAAC